MRCLQPRDAGYLLACAGGRVDQWLSLGCTKHRQSSRDATRKKSRALGLALIKPQVMAMQ